MKKLILIVAALLALLPDRAGAQSAQSNSIMETMFTGAVAKMQTGDIETAVKHFEYLDKHYPGNDAVNYWLGQCYAMLGRLDDAENGIRTCSRTST